jgi:glycosyltransferase involved in cell wall biosynthesis
MSKTYDDNAYLLKYLANKGNQLCVVAGRSLGFKGRGMLAPEEDMNGVRILRIYRNLYHAFLFPHSQLAALLRITRQFKPDLIFCSHEMDMRIAGLINKFCSAPVVLQVEDAGRLASGESNLSSLKARVAFGAIGLPSGRNYWKWLVKRAQCVITLNPRDQGKLSELSSMDTPCYFVPWCSQIPSDYHASPKVGGHGVYCGSLSDLKNTKEFGVTIPMLLDQTPTEEFVIIGWGASRHVALVRKLEEKYGERIRFVPGGLPRSKVLEIISSSDYGYTPVREGGWGFILDCWAVGTPLVMTHNDDNYVTPMFNALVSNSLSDLPSTVQLLYADNILSQKLRQKGFKSYLEHSPEEVGSRVLSIFEETLRGSLRT